MQKLRGVIWHPDAGHLSASRSVSTSVTSSVTLTADPALSIRLLRNSRYSIKVVLFFDVAGDGVKVALTGTETLAVSELTAQVLLYDTAGLQVCTRITALDQAVAHGHGGGGTDSHYVVMEGTLVTCGCGELAVAWAQETSNPAPLTLQAGSYIQAVRLL